MRGRNVDFSLILGLSAALLVVAPGASRSDGGFEVAGHANRLPEGQLAGGAFVLSGEVATSVEAFEDGQNQEPTQPLLPDGERSPTGTLCFCATAIFGDGFESGGTAAWSAALP